MQKESKIAAILKLVCALDIIFSLFRIIWGIDLTDESFYIADSVAMIRGNVPYSYCNFSYTTGFPFFAIPLIYLYGRIVPNLKGIILFTRICYVAVWSIVLFIFCNMICKQKDNYYKRLLFILLIFYCTSANMANVYNFSYNTIPSVFLLLAFALLYDIFENDGEFIRGKLFLSGFLFALVILANPGYGLASIVLMIILLVRSKGITKLTNMIFCGMGALMQILFAFVPIISQTGLEKLCMGLSLFFNPTTSSGSESETATVAVPYYLMRLFWFVSNHRWLILSSIGIIISSLALVLLLERTNDGFDIKAACPRIVAISTGFLTLVGTYETFRHKADNYMYGIMGVAIVVAMMLFGQFNKHTVLYYFGIYPIIIAVAEMMFVDSVYDERFSIAFPALAICIYSLLLNDSRLSKWIGVLCIGVISVSMLIVSFLNIRRDAPIEKLNSIVTEGVYAGLITTGERAEALPELEEYLNDHIGEDEYYELHDYASFGYLMTHTGHMCSRTTLDSNQYAYGINNPHELYKYYDRRGRIPDKLIYIDWGDTERLSIDDDSILFNEFVNNYYVRISDEYLNSLFKRIIIYKRNDRDVDLETLIDL